MIALVTDSGSQITPELRARFDVRVVPLTVVVEGEPFLEGVDLDHEKFYRRLEGGAEVSTAAPSPGLFLNEYRAAVDDGAEAIVSIHTGANVSATLNAAHVAASELPIPVEMVDTGLVSFPISLCVWAAGDARAERDHDVGQVAAAARHAATEVGNVFVIGVTELARRSGRMPIADSIAPHTTVVSLTPEELREVAQVDSSAEAVDEMAADIAAWAAGRPLRVGVGHAMVPDLADALAEQVRAQPTTAELVRYRVGPSVGAHSGAGTVGAVFTPLG